MASTDDTNEHGGETWQSPYRMTPETQAELLRALGLDARVIRTQAASGGSALRVQRVADGKVPADVMAVALQLKGHLGAHLGGGKYAVLCLNDAQHTNPDGTAENARGSCVLMPPLEGLPYGLPVCPHAHCAHLRRDDWLAFLGAEVWQRAQTIVAEMKSVGTEPAPEASTSPPDVDPLEGLADRIAAEKKPELAFDERVLDAALGLQADDGAAFEELLRKLRAIEGVKFGITRWLDALKVLRRRRKQAADEAERQAQMKALAERRAKRAQEVHAKQAAREAARATAEGDRAEHFRPPRTLDDVTYLMEPGRLWVERTVHAGTDRERTVQETLAGFSALLAEVVMDIDAPDTKPRPSLYVLFVVRGSGAPFRVEVPAEDWARAEWPERFIPSPGVGPGGRSTREHLRAAIEALSEPTTRYRYRYVGWARHEGRPVYLHAAGAIDANGDVEGLRAEVGDLLDRFALPPVVDFDAARDAGAVLALLGHEPAHVFAPLVGLAVRAAMGKARAAVHITSSFNAGKSTIVGVVAQLFGPSFDASGLLSWRDRTTIQGAMEVLSRSRDVFIPIDDLQRDPASQAKAKAIIPAHFNRSMAAKGKQRGGGRVEGSTQGVLGSSGETLPDEPSVRSRVMLLDLNTRPTPRPDRGENCIKARGDRGELARGMARFIQWWAPQLDAHAAKFKDLERDTTEAWGLGVDARAADVLGPAALGLHMLFQWLHAEGVLGGAALADAQERARVALRCATLQHVEHVEEEAHFRRFFELFREGLGAGKGHAAYARRAGKSLVFGDPPPDHTVWGWRTRQTHTTSTQGGSDSTTHFEQGPTVAYLHADKPGKVLIAPGPALRMAIDLARSSLRPLHVDVPALARELVAANVLTNTSKGRAVGRCKWSWGAKDVEGFEVDLAAVGMASAPETDAMDPPAPPPHPQPEDEEFPEVPPEEFMSDDPVS